MNELLLCADVSAAVGSGRVVRCLALAQAWRDLGGTAALLAAELPEALMERCRVVGVEVRRLEDGTEDVEVTAAQADWLVVDGYRFDSRFVTAVARVGRRVLRIDDIGLPGPSMAVAGVRTVMSVAALDLANSRGALRVAAEMLAHCALDRLRLRPATAGDARLLFEWANDPAARAASFQGGVIGWEEHVGWLGRRLVDPDCLLWFVETPAGVPAGVVRFDLDAGGEVTISLNLAPSQRGRRLATPLILAACRELRRRHPGVLVRALIKPETLASLRAFVRAGFERQADVVVAGQKVRCMIQRGV